MKSIEEFGYTVQKSLLRFLQEHSTNLASINAFCLRLGWMPNINADNFTNLLAIANIDDVVSEMVDTMSNFDLLNKREKLQSFIEVIESMNSVYSAINSVDTSSISSDFFPLSEPEFWQDLGSKLPSLVLHDEILSSNPGLYSFLRLSGFLRVELSTPSNNNRIPYNEISFDVSNLTNFVSNPLDTIKAQLGITPSAIESEKLAHIISELGTLANCEVRPRIPSQNTAPQFFSQQYPQDWDISEIEIPIFEFVTVQADLISLGLKLLPIPETPLSNSAPSKLVVEPFLHGLNNAEFQIGKSWTMSIPTSPQSPIRSILDVTDNSWDTSFNSLDSLAIRFTHRPDNGLKQIKFGNAVSLSYDALNIEFGLSNQGMSLSLFSSDKSYWENDSRERLWLNFHNFKNEGFLSKLLDFGSTRLGLDYKIVWENGKIAFDGSSQLELTVSNEKTIGQSISLKNTKISINAQDESIRLKFQSDFRVDLNALYFELLGVGGQLVLDSTSQNEIKDLGPVGLESKFNPPDGISIGSNSEKVNISGLVLKDEEKYVGAIDVIIDEYAFSAIGILTTEMPDGSDGYSFLALVSMEIPSAIPLAFGFYLKGVGGLVAINRDMDAQALQDGVRNGTLDNILFPTNILANFNQIITDLETVFPVKEGRHSFALMGKLNYGNNDILQLEAGLLVSVPSPVLFGMGGVAHITYPENDGGKLDLNCSFIGLFDLGKKLFSFDASIYNSSIAGIPVQGDIVARLAWGTNKHFIISLGGFHPEYSPDTSFYIPQMQRLSLIIRNTDELKIYGDSYFAVTSNTFQIGSQLSLNYAKGNLQVNAMAGFDALFNFNPFFFQANIGLSAEVEWKGESLMGVFLDFYIQGPGPWYARGAGRVEILGFEVKARFEKTFGNPDYSQLPKVEVLPLVQEELGKNSSWISTGVADNSIVFADLASDEPILSPGGGIEVSQKIVPLGINLGKIGESEIINFNRFDLENPTIDNTPLSSRDALDSFAPAQFLSLNSRDRLKAKSFEEMKSGLNLGTDELGVKIPDVNQTKTVIYEAIYASGNPVTENIGMSSEHLDFLAKGGAISRTTTFSKNKRVNKKKRKVRTRGIDYRIVDHSNLEIMEGYVSSKSEFTTNQQLQDSLELGETGLRVAPEFEFTEIGMAQA